jgi:tyrosine aminotransferase
LAFGCSGALYNAVSALCEVGDTILVPSPGFPLCQPICQNLGVEFDNYCLMPDEGWKIDLADLRSKITPRTRAILVNNPSNPCGSCFTLQHMQEILAVADEFKVPIISDEVYYGLTYDPERPFISFGNATSTVPVICTGAISKIYCLPGWRLGWTIVYNNQGYFDDVIVRMGMHAMI